MIQALPFSLTILAVVVMGYIFTSENRFYSLGAIILFLVLLIFGTINLLVFFSVTALLVNRIHGTELGNPFLLLGTLAILSGFFLYEGLKKFNKSHQISEVTLTLVEYCIQWSLIYATMYQSIFDSIAKIHTTTRMVRTARILNPDPLAMIVLSSFIPIWISVVLLKKYQHDL